jgi:hypothetical protein
MYSEFENLNSSTVSKKAGNSKGKVAKSDGSHGIGSAWIHALTLAWIATLFLSVASACTSLP